MKYTKPEVLEQASAVTAIESGSALKPEPYRVIDQHLQESDGAYEADE